MSMIGSVHLYEWWQLKMYLYLLLINLKYKKKFHLKEIYIFYLENNLILASPIENHGWFCRTGDPIDTV